jgi:hypothetical protein
MLVNGKVVTGNKVYYDFVLNLLPAKEVWE